ncbi:vacuolar protein sorting-associated protein 9A isoform X2 [Cryptomeria japonica]|nr:vacuolar protein sorting-associated protein 9A isoform X2 [Cryptomeria japonica]
MEAAFKAHPLWAGATEDELDSAGEGLEKYLMTKLFNRAFASFPEDAKHDQELSEKISLVQQFIRPEHLDILPNFQNETSWLLAQKELQKINTYKAPRDKLVCILNCCRVINNLLLNVSMATNDNPPGADDFLPVLIYVTIKANPPQLHSNLLYIQRYRRQSRLVSEAAYFFTNLVSAESFISDIDAKSLSIDESEFERNMTIARFALNGTTSHVDYPVSYSSTEAGNFMSDSSVPKAQVPKLQKKEKTEEPVSVVGDSQVTRTLAKGLASIGNTDKSNKGNVKDNLEGSTLTVSKLENKGAVHVLHAERTGQLNREYPFLYARAGDLRVEEIEPLLNAYKELVLKYVSLSKEVETSLSNKMPSLYEGDAQSREVYLDISKEKNNQQAISSANLSVTIEADKRTQIDNFKQEMKHFDEGGLQLGTETDHHDSPLLSPRLTNTYGELPASNSTEMIEMEQLNTHLNGDDSRVDQASEKVTVEDVMPAVDSEQSCVTSSEMLQSKEAPPNAQEHEGL